MYSSQYMKIVNEIASGKSCNEICDSLNISRKQLYYYMQLLKNDGIDFNRKYYSNGVIRYSPISKLRDMKDGLNQINLITPHGTGSEMFLVISDTHFGNEKERIDLLNRAYNYAIKNGIHIILIAGDLLDGNYTLGVKEREFGEIVKQIEHFLKDYPFDKNIINIAVLGDHDYSVLNGHFVNLKEVINSKRHDIAVGGFNSVSVGVKNDNIMLFHHLTNGAIPPIYAPIILKGHSHYFSVNHRDDSTLDVTVPSLSDIKDVLPSALVLEVEFKDGYISEADVKQVLFLDKDYVVSTYRYTFNRNIGEKIIPIKNEERMPQEIIKEDVENNGRVLKKKKGERVVVDAKGNC